MGTARNNNRKNLTKGDQDKLLRVLKAIVDQSVIMGETVINLEKRTDELNERVKELEEGNLKVKDIEEGQTRVKKFEENPSLK